MRDMRFDGKTDEEGIIQVIGLLSDLGIPRHCIIPEPFVIINPGTDAVITHTSCITDYEMSIYAQRCSPFKPLIHHPDILVTYHSGDIRFLTELDGSYHHTKPGMKQTCRRNDDYSRCRLKCVVIETEMFDQARTQLEKMIKLTKLDSI